MSRFDKDGGRQRNLAALGSLMALSMVLGAPVASSGEREPEAPLEMDLRAPVSAMATAELRTVEGSTMKARARFEEMELGVRVVVEVQGAQPGPKGVHVHEKGDCRAIAERSMGDHFAPRGKPHGLPGAPSHHLGDLGNVEIAENGAGYLEILARDATLDPEHPQSFLGRALVIHEGEDQGTQPAGDAGDPIACGVIRRSDVT